MICKCGWKHTDPKKCPMCGVKVDKRIRNPLNGKQGTRSNLTSRLEPGFSHDKAKNMAQHMRAYAIARYSENTRQVPCDNCGMLIRELKFENIAHIERRNNRPELRTDPENFITLCGPTDYFGKVDRSCHTLFDTGKMEAFNKKGEL